jgi:hydroxymethylpyrimidine pyrophosphatase-like HAD family hydrolase
MRYRVLAADYDGTVAHHGRVAPSTVEALRKLKESGRKLVLVTGRQLEDLQGVFPELDLFNRVVAENGAVLYRPSTKELRSLGEAPPVQFAERLRKRIPAVVSVGHVIVATWHPHEVETLELIQEMGLELQVIFNKGAVMVLPSGMNKATGLAAALEDLSLSPRNAVGVGDAENDHAFLSCCECAVAVANALPAVKQRADLVTRADHGAGVEELIEQLVSDDLAASEAALGRHGIALAAEPEEGSPGSQVIVSPYSRPVLFAGSSGAGKSSLATAFIEALGDRGYQTCIIDPEGDMRDLPASATLGDADRAPSISEVLELLASPRQNVTVSLVGVPLADRATYFESLLPRLLELRARTGRPHWIVVDETHHVAPSNRHPTGLTLPPGHRGLLYITVHPNHVAPMLLAEVEMSVTFGSLAGEALRELAGIRQEKATSPLPPAPDRGQAIAWFRGRPPVVFSCRMPRAERRRHVRKYAAGELGPDKSFYFKGPEEKLNLRAYNLELFVQMADGVDDETWLHHLRQGDYSRWFLEAIKDPGLSEEAAAVEADPALAAHESRARIRAAIESRYTAAA